MIYTSYTHTHPHALNILHTHTHPQCALHMTHPHTYTVHFTHRIPTYIQPHIHSVVYTPHIHTHPQCTLYTWHIHSAHPHTSTVWFTHVTHTHINSVVYTRHTHTHPQCALHTHTSTVHNCAGFSQRPPRFVNGDLKQGSARAARRRQSTPNELSGGRPELLNPQPCSCRKQET